MAPLARVLSRLSGVEINVETLKSLMIFCGLGLLITLFCAMTFGLDVGAGFL